MTITLNCSYLGHTVNDLSDGGQFSTVNFYDFSSNEPLSVNVMHSSSNIGLVADLQALSPRDDVEITLRLVPRDKLYKLQLVGLALA